MARERYKYGDELPLPYWVRLSKVDSSTSGRGADDVMLTLLHLDLRGGEFTRASHYRLERVFDWLTRAFPISQHEVNQYCLVLTPLEPGRDFAVVDGVDGQVRSPEDWPVRRGESFRWLPIAIDEDEERYAWQR